MFTVSSRALNALPRFLVTCCVTCLQKCWRSP